MKKILLIPALLLGSIAIAQDYNYEITPVVGYNIAEGNLKLKNQTLYGAELQYNGCNSLLKPEVSILYTDADYKNSLISTDIYRIALNGVYEFGKIGMIKPLAKIGLGYETMDNHLADNKDSIFINAGIGAKVPFTDAIALKVESVYMSKNNDGRLDSNLALLAGVNFAFGAKTQPAPAPTPVAAPAPVVAPVVAPAPTPAPKPVDGDDDKDGVLNSVDKCPNTPIGHKVDKDGCSKLVNLHINFDTASYKVKDAYQSKVKEFADFMKTMPNYDAKIVGHTDSVGSDKSNQTLSENRANAVKNLIIKEGVEAKRISSKGMGEKAPTTTNDTVEGKAENRRIEAELIKK
ncbi:MAG: OmpA family protein [Sulfurimonas sp.]|uniref:OmpA family protein n=1 Tax=Sulfurimonas sp. TaxID=2022749 RepID=UPI002619EF0F|nr:OmpA family protein [Sulfurimonas sp.]MDD5372994.1 OmpA family protein [Sulfurimonas sp.]